MAKRRNKKRLQMQKKRPRVRQPNEMDAVVGDIDGDQMMAWVQSLTKTGSYPCPICGSSVELVEDDHYQCVAPDCPYEAYWSFGG